MQRDPGLVEIHITEPKASLIGNIVRPLLGPGDSLSVRYGGTATTIFVQTQRGNELLKALQAQGIEAQQPVRPDIPLDGIASSAVRELVSGFQNAGASLVEVGGPVPLEAMRSALIDAGWPGLAMLLADPDKAKGGAGGGGAAVVKCPNPVYIGTGKVQGLALVPFPELSTVREEQGVRDAEADGRTQALAAAVDASGKTKRPDCSPCTCVLSVTFKSDPPQRTEYKTLPDDAPKPVKDAAKTFGVGTAFLKIAVDVTWTAFWVCKQGDGVPQKPPDGAGGGVKTFVGGEEIELPCPHPFLQGMEKVEKQITQNDAGIGTADAFEAAKKRLQTDVGKELVEKVFTAIKKALAELPRCPAECPQRGPVSIQIGPQWPPMLDEKNFFVPFNIPAYSCTGSVHWSVERDCRAASGAATPGSGR